MQFFLSVSTPIAVQQVGAVIAVVLFVRLVGVQLDTAPGAISSPTPVLYQPSGEVWT
jgi:hypothetical protein